MDLGDNKKSHFKAPSISDCQSHTVANDSVGWANDVLFYWEKTDEINKRVAFEMNHTKHTHQNSPSLV